MWWTSKSSLSIIRTFQGMEHESACRYPDRRTMRIGRSDPRDTNGDAMACNPVDIERSTRRHFFHRRYFLSAEVMFHAGVVRALGKEGRTAVTVVTPGMATCRMRADTAGAEHNRAMQPCSSGQGEQRPDMDL